MEYGKQGQGQAGERVGHERVLATMTGAGADAFNAIIAAGYRSVAFGNTQP